jgi:hypothetical protein
MEVFLGVELGGIGGDGMKLARVLRLEGDRFRALRGSEMVVFWSGILDDSPFFIVRSVLSIYLVHDGSKLPGLGSIRRQ